MPHKPYRHMVGTTRRELERFLGTLELAIMKVIWQRESVTVRDVLNTLHEERHLAYTTVMTVMQRLADKGLLLQEKQGKTHHYRAAQTRDEFAASAAASVVRSLLADFGDVAIAEFVKEVEATDPEQLRRLARLAHAAGEGEDDNRQAEI